MCTPNSQLPPFMLLFVLSFLCPFFANAQAPIPRSSHVVLIMEENTSYSTTVAEMPWLVSQGSVNGHTANYVSNTSGSLMDYLWVASGSCHAKVNCVLPAGTHDFGCGGDGCIAPNTPHKNFRGVDKHGISREGYLRSYAPGRGEGAGARRGHR